MDSFEEAFRQAKINEYIGKEFAEIRRTNYNGYECSNCHAGVQPHFNFCSCCGMKFNKVEPYNCNYE